jgi:thiol-disulfide isomerase/thioredoxin
MKKIALFLVILLLPLSSYAFPANVLTTTPAEIVRKIETSNQPFTLVVFTSWCPYCKKQLDELAKLTPAEQLRIHEVLAVSIDSNPQDYSNYLRSKTGVFFPMRLYMGDSNLENILHDYGSGFDGGIPYIAIFNDKKIVKEFDGYTHPSALTLAQ